MNHNEKGQAVDGIDEAEILEIIDHHRLGSMETALPVFFRNQPVGCTGTIIYDLYQENNVEVDKKIAGLLWLRNHFRYADVPFSYLHPEG